MRKLEIDVVEKAAQPWVQCTTESNDCLGGCRTAAEHARYANPTTGACGIPGCGYHLTSHPEADVRLKFLAGEPPTKTRKLTPQRGAVAECGCHVALSSSSPAEHAEERIIHCPKHAAGPEALEILADAAAGGCDAMAGPHDSPCEECYACRAVTLLKKAGVLL
jgi:hypothetical protein